MPGAGFSSLGRKGLPADKVANAAVRELKDFAASGKAIDRYLADQLLIPMALAIGRSSFTTDRLTRHTMTNASLLRQILGCQIRVDGGIDKPGKVYVDGTGYSRD
jgi:RNA 3'-terminal phosphate cyclase (ATP)